MSVDHVLAVIPVADFEAAHAWYERLFGHPADNLPIEGLLVEWRVTDSGWVQVTRDADRAGSALLNFAVDDLDQQRRTPSGVAEHEARARSRGRGRRPAGHGVGREFVRKPGQAAAASGGGALRGR